MWGCVSESKRVCGAVRRQRATEEDDREPAEADDDSASGGGPEPDATPWPFIVPDRDTTVGGSVGRGGA